MSSKVSGFKTLSSKLIYQARLYKLKKVSMKAPDGHRFQHEVIYHPGAAVIVPLLKEDQFVLVRQFRTAVRRAIWEFPAGTLERGEKPLACAKREIIEEIGFKAKKWEKLTKFYPAPGMSTELMHIYLAEGLSPALMEHDRDEFMERHIVSRRDLQKMIERGIIVDAKTIVGFYFYCRKRGLRKD